MHTNHAFGLKLIENLPYERTVEINDYLEEITDRFGPPPDEVIALLKETEIRCLAEEAGFDLIETRKMKSMPGQTRKRWNQALSSKSRENLHFHQKFHF